MIWPNCKVCKHAERPTIDVGLAQRRPVKALMKRFGVSKYSLYRHRKGHLPPSAIARILAGSPYEVENLEALRTTEGERLLANTVEVRRRLYRIAECAEETGDYKAAVAAYAQINASLNLLGKMLDQFASHSRVINNSLVISPDYLKLRAGLIQALEPFPQARVAVAKVLRDLETVEVPANGNGLVNRT